MKLTLSPLASLRSRTFVRQRGLTALALVMALIGGVLVGDSFYIKAKAGVAQILLEKAWSRTLTGETEAKPWNWADTWPVAMLAVPRLNEASIVLDSVSGQAMAFAPGLMHGPRPGEPGLAIISAHRDTHFKFLKDIAIGDTVEVTNADGALVIFKITETRIVEANASGLYQSGTTARIALVTCWPFDALQRGTKRFVAIGERARQTT